MENRARRVGQTWQFTTLFIGMRASPKLEDDMAARDKQGVAKNMLGACPSPLIATAGSMLSTESHIHRGPASSGHIARSIQMVWA